MQRGSLVRSKRKHGPDVWQFRWSERGPNRKRVYRRRVIGTVEQYQDEGAARGAVAVLVSEINSHQPIAPVNPLTVAQLADHFEQRELGRDNTWRSYAPRRHTRDTRIDGLCPTGDSVAYLRLERSKSSVGFGVFRWQRAPVPKSET